MQETFVKQRIYFSKKSPPFDTRRLAFIFLGLGLFFWLYLIDPLPDAIDPAGRHFPLSNEGKAAIALFLLAGTWWVFEVIPVGVTSLAIGVIQAVFLIRPVKTAFNDFMDPSVLFIFGSLIQPGIDGGGGHCRRHHLAIHGHADHHPLMRTYSHTAMRINSHLHS